MKMPGRNGTDLSPIFFRQHPKHCKTWFELVKRGSEDDNGDADDAFFDGGMSLGSSTGDMECDSHERNRPL